MSFSEIRRAVCVNFHERNIEVLPTIDIQLPRALNCYILSDSKPCHCEVDSPRRHFVYSVLQFGRLKGNIDSWNTRYGQRL